LFAIPYCGIASTALAYLCQLYAQRHMPATETAVLLTFEPVVAALVSIAVGREAWSTALLFGGLLILAAMLLSELGAGADAVPPPAPPPTAAPPPPPPPPPSPPPLPDPPPQAARITALALNYLTANKSMCNPRDLQPTIRDGGQ